MAYLNANTWNVAAARRAGGLGDWLSDIADSASYVGPAPAPAPTILDPIPVNGQFASEIAYGETSPVASAGSAESSIVGVLNSLTNAFTPATVPTPSSIANPPAPEPAGISSTALEYIAIAAGAVLLLALFSRRGRR